MQARMAAFLAVVALGVLTGCAGSGSGGQAGGSAASLPLNGTYWLVTAIDGSAVGTDSDRDNSPAHLLFDTRESRVGGSGGVNRLAGGFTLNGDAIRFGPIAQTQMAGEPAKMAVEQKLGQAMERVRRYEISGTTLRLKSETGEILVVLQGISPPPK